MEVTQMTFSCSGKDGPGRPREAQTPKEHLCGGRILRSIVLGNFPMVGDHEGCKGWGGMEHVFPEIWGDGCPLRDVWEEQGSRSRSVVYCAW